MLQCAEDPTACRRLLANELKEIQINQTTHHGLA